MFFSINRVPQENFTHHWMLNGFAINTDDGWSQKNIDQYSIVFKGYADANKLDDILESIAGSSTPVTTGNFCAIVLNHQTQKLSIKTDRYRSFPIYVGTECITNLLPQDKTIWTDGIISVDADFSVTEDKFDVIGNINITSSTIEQIDQFLREKIAKWAAVNDLPLRVFLSGGIDTLLVYSYIKSLNIDHTIVWCNHIDHDNFWLANHDDIVKYWGYTQIHHWTEPCILASGSPGDEFTLRSPTTANLFLLHHGTSMFQLLTENPSSLHFSYFLWPKHVSLFAEQIENYVPCKTNEDLIYSLCNIDANDWQHWHIGNTLTYTPLRDLELFKLFLNLPFDIAKKQIIDSFVSKQLIEKNVPGLLAGISDQKNVGNYMKNLRRLR